jgi:HK97 gp10 family phage protein
VTAMGIHIDGTEVRHLALDLRAASGRVGAKASAAIRKTALDIERTAKVLAPVDTGNLENTISTDIEGDGRFGSMTAEIGPTAHYGDDVEYGTQPHVIRARPGGYLVFRGRDGGLVVAKEVNHPGTPPQPYMGPAFDRHAPGLERALGDAGEDIV